MPDLPLAMFKPFLVLGLMYGIVEILINLFQVVYSNFESGYNED